VAGVAGVSCGAAQTIARLLMPARFGADFGRLGDLAVLGEATVDGVECLRVAATHPYAGREELCIGRHDALLRKLGKRSRTCPSPRCARGSRWTGPRRTSCSPSRNELRAGRIFARGGARRLAGTR
jgi:hypothetical protein